MEVSEHSSELGRWQTLQRPADPRLRAYVHGYFASSSLLRRPVRERHLPSTEVPLLLNFGAPHRVSDAASAKWSSRDGAWIVGLHDKHQVSEAAGERHFMVVRFTPIGAHLFLGVPMHSIANQALGLEQIDPALGRTVLSRVGTAQSWIDRFAAMEALIAERIACADLPGAVGLIWRRLVATDGSIALGSLTSELDCSHRTLIARFRTCVGFPPKTIARLLRFNRALRSLDKLSALRVGEPAGKPYIEEEAGVRSHDAIAWADIAADCGYFDQAHFIRDFREFAGSTPTAFLRQVSDLN